MKFKCKKCGFETNVGGGVQHKCKETVTMTKKDYEFIARIIHALKDKGETRGSVAVHFAEELARENPRFDRTRFLTACDATTDKAFGR